jgi:hypothetical protein
MAKRTTVLLTRVALVLLGLSPGPGMAQTAVPPGSTRPVAPSGPTVENEQVEGLIRAIDPLARTITLDNGQVYFVPAGMADLTRLDAGQSVKLRYGIDGGRNFTREVRIQP